MTNSVQTEARTSARTLLILPRMHGFFSLVFQAVGRAHEAEEKGLTPVVYFNRHCPYWSDAGYNGERNLWTYFFEPLSSTTIESLFPGVPLWTLEDYDLNQFEQLCAGTGITPISEYPEDVVEYRSPIGVLLQRRFINSLLNRYAVLKPHIRAKVDAYEQAHFASHPVIGVHYRGTEKSLGKTKDGVVKGKTVSMIDFYLREIRSRLQRFPEAKVFVATDSAEFLMATQKEFGNVVLSRDATRLSKDDEVLGLHFKQQEDLTKPLLAEEVLLDSLVLSRTNFLIHGVSNVSNAALCFNPDLKHFDVEFLRGSTGFYVKKEVIRQLERMAPSVVSSLRRRFQHRS